VFEQGIKRYIQKEHPVQKEIFNLVHELTGLKNIPTETDGCSAPTPFMTLETIARLFQKLGAGNHQELSRVFDAMCANPILVGGTNRFDSLFIEALAGRGLTKIGGESVRGISIKKPSGGSVGIALKVLDGNFRAMSIATMKLLEHLELLNPVELEKLDKFRMKILRNHNQLEIGRIETIVET
jgi:L-asparaginase II